MQNAGNLLHPGLQGVRWHVTSRSQGLFPPRTQDREKTLGTRLRERFIKIFGKVLRTNLFPRVSHLTARKDERPRERDWLRTTTP